MKAFLVRRQLRLDFMKQDQLIISLISSDSDDRGGIRPRKCLAELRSEHRARLIEMKEARKTRTINVTASINSVD